MNTLDEKVVELRSNKDEKGISDLIEQYKPYIIRIVSNTKRSYVEIDNDEELSIGLMAFYEAIERYEPDKGKFLSYAAIVIESRVKSYILNEKKHYHQNIESIEEPASQKMSIEEKYEIVNEIEVFERTLGLFKITLDQLTDQAPKHIDTRKNAVDISVKTSHEKDLIQFFYSKFRLPITKIAERFLVSIKVIKGSKSFIIACIIILTKNLEALKEWLNYE